MAEVFGKLSLKFNLLQINFMTFYSVCAVNIVCLLKVPEKVSKSLSVRWILLLLCKKKKPNLRWHLCNKAFFFILSRWTAPWVPWVPWVTVKILEDETDKHHLFVLSQMFLNNLPLKARVGGLFQNLELADIFFSFCRCDFYVKQEQKNISIRLRSLRYANCISI